MQIYTVICTRCHRTVVHGYVNVNRHCHPPSFQRRRVYKLFQALHRISSFHSVQFQNREDLRGLSYIEPRKQPSSLAMMLERHRVPRMRSGHYLGFFFITKLHTSRRVFISLVVEVRTQKKQFDDKMEKMHISWRRRVFSAIIQWFSRNEKWKDWIWMKA